MKAKVASIGPLLDVEAVRKELNSKFFKGRKPYSTKGARERFDSVMQFVDDLTGQGFEVDLDVEFSLKIVAPKM